MSTAFHLPTDGQTEQINASMEQFLRVFVSHQQDEWVQRLAVAEFAANDGISEMAKCTQFCLVQGSDSQVSFAGETT